MELDEMLKLESSNGCFFITGYPDGGEWITRALPSNIGKGIVGNRFWHCGSDGKLGIFDALERRKVGHLKFPPSGLHGATHCSLASRDGRHLYLVEQTRSGFEAGKWVGPDVCVLRMIDLERAEIVAQHDGLHGRFFNGIVERPDGKLLLNWNDHWSADSRKHSLMLLDPRSGEREVSTIPAASIPGLYTGLGFISCSPDGRYWVRFDHTRLPALYPQTSIVQKAFGKRSGEPFYGITFQIWEAFPLRFVRRVTAAWVKVQNFGADWPGDTDSDGTRRRALWAAISDTLRRQNREPTDPPLLLSDLPPLFSSHDELGKFVESHVYGGINRLVGRDQLLGWQPDGQAFWFKVNGFVSCVGIDGTISPRLFTERRGYNAHGYGDLPQAPTVYAVEALPDRKARVLMGTEEFIYDGKPSASPHLLVGVPMSNDGWKAYQERRDDTLLRKSDEFLKDANRLVIRVEGEGEAALFKAIDALTGKMTASIYRRERDSELKIVFVVGKETLEEAAFFDSLMDASPAVLPPLARLIERFVEVGASNDFLFSVGEEGIGLLASAVRTLGVRDLSALPTIKRYGRLVDPEHEYYFAGQTVPAMIAAHGWTDDMVDFVFWVAIMGYFNTVSFSQIWSNWGLRNAVAGQVPKAVARRMALTNADLIAQRGTRWIATWQQEINGRDETWLEAFLDELRMIRPPAAG
jgi:hypothetical protein